uniref:F-box/LRR-repeat protein 4 n=1 Tax=Culex pipiens TaxID=7175 RepID=A0A8D8FQ96_CULPI
MLSDYSLLSSDGDETSSYAETTDDEEAVFLQLSAAVQEGEAGTDADGGKLVTINQYAQDVVDFSTQYGSDTSISYTAYNVTGKPSKYPDYGDFPETFAFRTYGTWWKQAPSVCGEFGDEQPAVDDYILVRFEEPVLPEQIKVFETYNPGAIVRIWAYTQAEQWFLLWDVESGNENLPPVERNHARIFCPPLNPAPSPTRFIRFEFNHAQLEYSTQLDAILMLGQKFVPNVVPSKKQKFLPKITVNQEVILQNYSPDLECTSQASSRSATPTESGLTLDQMPYDVLFNIMAHLDLRSLYRCGQVCRTLHHIVAVDSLLYAELNLKPYWACASSAMLQSLKKRCAFTKKLNLSWCGLFNKISVNEFKDFIAKCGPHLTHLRLDSCKFMTTGSCLETIGRYCPDNLTDLSLQNYQPQTRDFTALASLHHLERLNLNRTSIDTQSLLIVLARNPTLRHLNLAFCPLDVSMDDVALQIAKCNRGALVSLDMWKSHSLTSVGLEALAAHCPKLEEVDFGWCLREEASPGEAIRALVRSCPRLKKLFLAAIRGLTDRDLDVIATHCTGLQQLDLMGSMGISTEMCYRLLTRCRKLKLLDLSFCENLDNMQIMLWRECFDVAIKRSFVDFGPPRGEF